MNILKIPSFSAYKHPINFNSGEKRKSNHKNETQKVFSYPFTYPNFSSPLENYETAENIFRNNLKNGKPIFGTTKDVYKFWENPRIKMNIIKFLPVYAEEEAAKILSAGIRARQDREKFIGYMQIREFFKDYPLEEEQAIVDAQNKRDFTQYRQVAFAGKMTPEQESEAKDIVHWTALACAGTSALMGEAAAFGVEPWILRGTQFLMFQKLQHDLKVPAGASAIYMFKEMYAGCVLGIEGAKILSSMGALAVEAGTGGTATLPATGALRFSNGTLSFLVTEKMGRGYIRRVKANNMTFARQALEAGTYFGGKLFFIGVDGIAEEFTGKFSAVDGADAVKKAIEAIPDEKKEAMGEMLSSMIGLKTAERTSALFMWIFLPTFFGNKLFVAPEKQQDIKTMLKNSFKTAFFTSLVYELCDLATGEAITKEAEHTIKKFQEDFENSPGLCKEYLEKEKAFLDAVNIDTLSSEEFINQFKNKSFVFNLSLLTKDMIREIRDTWLSKESRKVASEGQKNAAAAAAAIKAREHNRGILTPLEQAQISRDMARLKKLFEAKKDMLSVTQGFGYDKIAGYQRKKELLLKAFLTPLALKNNPITETSAVPPRAIMFYGPTNTGKSTMAGALAEQGKCRTKVLRLGINHKDDSNAMEDFINNSNRHVCIIIDEAERLKRYPQTSEKIFRLMKTNPNVTFIMTTNNPEQIDGKLIGEAVKVPFGPADNDDIKSILKKYLLGKIDKNFDYEKVSQEIIKRAKSGAISNSQIAEVCKNLRTTAKGQISTADVLERIKVISPEISQEDLKNFAKQKEIFNP